MKIVMMACTPRGFEAMRRAADGLRARCPGADIVQCGRCAAVPGYEDGPGLRESTARWFPQADALVFFAAAGIAVRCIAPFVRDKFRDPAVLSVDENGKFAIALLSGHVGGANRLCLLLAGVLGAQPVITTATDGRGLFAADVYASENGLFLHDREAARRASARLLAGETLSMYWEDAFAGGWIRAGAQGGSWIPGAGSGIRVAAGRGSADILVTCRRLAGDLPGALYLVPRAVTLGIGCRRGTSCEAIEAAVGQVLGRTGVFRQALCGIASIDLKRGEPGLHAFAQKEGLPLTFYTAQELGEVGKGISAESQAGSREGEREARKEPQQAGLQAWPEGTAQGTVQETAQAEAPWTFSESAFVREVTGVGCVCERSAVRLAGPRARLLEKKNSLHGVTVAFAAAGIGHLNK